MKHIGKNRAGRATELGPVLLLAFVIAVPTIAVLWFVRIAMDNQQLATQQQLTDAYRGHLENARQQLLERFQADCEELTSPLRDETPVVDKRPAALFAHLIQAPWVDAAVIYDSDGEVAYPQRGSISVQEYTSANWLAAQRLELRGDSVDAALEAYQSIADSAASETQKMAAYQAQLRSLFTANRVDQATLLALELLDRNEFKALTEPPAQAIAANIQLMLVQRLESQQASHRLLESLLSFLEYDGPTTLYSAQRLFIMKQLQVLAPDRVDEQQIRAEELANQYVRRHATLSETDGLQSTQMIDVWQLTKRQENAVLLVRTENLSTRFAELLQSNPVVEGISIQPHAPGQANADDQNEPLLSMAMGNRFPGWRLSLALRDQTLIDSTIRQRSRLVFWIGTLVVLVTGLSATGMIQWFRRKIRVANLKNDLVGTVSHELKTPLSSMRLLVDTLLEDSQLDEQTTRDYLQLIAQENTRLSRLIENFLTFSRIEREGPTLDIQALRPSAVVNAAVQASTIRFQTPENRLTINVSEQLPMIQGDMDALVTVILNLLDNAYKYSEPPRTIHIEADVRTDGRSNKRKAAMIQFSVKDNGIGLTRTAARRVFRRFFQVDQSLSRKVSGCGLGLSIVDSIVSAHRGEVGVESENGEGSRFYFSIPIHIDQRTPGAASSDASPAAPTRMMNAAKHEQSDE